MDNKINQTKFYCVYLLQLGVRLPLNFVNIYIFNNLYLEWHLWLKQKNHFAARTYTCTIIALKTI